MSKKCHNSKIVRSSILLLNSRLCSIPNKACRMCRTLWEIHIRFPKVRFQFKHQSTTILNPTVYILRKLCTTNRSLSIRSSNRIPNNNWRPFLFLFLLRPNRSNLNNLWIISCTQQQPPHLLNHRTLLIYSKHRCNSVWKCSNKI